MGVGFDAWNKEEALAAAIHRVEQGAGGYVVTPNPEFVYACMEDPALHPLLRDAAMVVPDGIGIVYAAKILGKSLTTRVPGIELGEALIAWMAGTGKRLYLLGAKPGVAEKAAENLTEKYPGLLIAGTHDGYFQDDAPIVELVKAADPDVMLVCTGFPKAERFMRAHQDALPHCLMLGLGGSLDVFAGNVRRAPVLYRKLGLEWLYRLLKEPKRIGRMMRLPAFLWRVILYRLKFGRKEA